MTEVNPETVYPAISEEEIIEDAHVVEAMIIFCDPNASTILLAEVVTDYIDSYDIEEITLDLETQASASIARRLVEKGVPFYIATYADEMAIYPGAEDLVEKAAGNLPIDPRLIHSLRSKVMIVPAMVANGSETVDVLNPTAQTEINLAPTTRCGIVFHEMGAANRETILVDTPERGLIAIHIPDEVIPDLSETTRAQISNNTLYRRRLANLAPVKTNQHLFVPPLEDSV